MTQRYISNNLPPQKLGSDPKELLTYALELVVRHTPPREVYHERHLGGLFTGYTGLAYLFLQLSQNLWPRPAILGETLPGRRPWKVDPRKGQLRHLVRETILRISESVHNQGG
ncbi:hypothetical protein LB505_006979 [Fusarium chuoi]|nr:hypothetical protein LB505_006979 [Fusarium chuoi]